MRPASKTLASMAAAFLLALGVPHPAAAERVSNEVAVFAALDKVTARISRLPVPLGETATFGSLKVTPRACYSSPPTEQPATTTFAEVDEIGLDGDRKRIFSGWMFAESPGLNAVEHSVFDVWLTGCEKPRKGLAGRGPEGPPDDARTGDPAEAEFPEEPRRRVRR